MWCLDYGFVCWDFCVCVLRWVVGLCSLVCGGFRVLYDFYGVMYFLRVWMLYGCLDLVCCGM